MGEGGGEQGLLGFRIKVRTLGFLLIMPQISGLWWCCVPPLSGASPPFAHSGHITWSFCGHLEEEVWVLIPVLLFITYNASGVFGAQP